METSDEVWEQLCDILEPATVSDDEIRMVRAYPTKRGMNYGINLETIEPDAFSVRESESSDEPPSPEDIDFDSVPEETEDIENNESLFIHEEPAPTLIKLMYESLESAIIDTPTFCNIQPNNYSPIVIQEDETEFGFDISITSIGRDELFTELRDLMADMDYIENPSFLASATIDSIYETQNSEFGQDGWHIDGTAYRYTKEPYEYWSKSADNESPVNMDEWVEFSAETEAQANLVRNRDMHAIHFHPRNDGLDNNHPLVQWLTKAEERLYEKFTLECKEMSLSEVITTPYQTTIQATIRVI
jgi:hypothetical protein